MKAERLLQYRGCPRVSHGGEKRARLPLCGCPRRQGTDVCSSHGSARLLPASGLAPCPPWGGVRSETIGIVNSISDAAAEAGRMPSRQRIP